VVIPVARLRERLIDAVVEVLVVGEDDMATDVEELGERQPWTCLSNAL